jgi:hypothetical protein
MIGLVDMKKLYVILFAVLCVLFTKQALAATLYSQAANQEVYVDQSFVVDWYLDSEGKSINSLDLKLNFSPDTLEVANASTGNSLVSLWIKSPVADNNSGSLELVGGIPNGLNSDHIPIFRTVITAKKEGPAFIRLGEASAVLLNDGLGTSELMKFKNEEFNVYPKDFQPIEISSSTHPDSNKWYSLRDVALKFLPKADTDYSYSFSSNIEIIPGNLTQEIPNEIKYQSEPDGIYYFKLNSKVGPSNWQEAGVYRIQIDATSPEEFQPVIGSDSSILKGNPFLSFSTVDKTSGISHYTVKVGLFGKGIETQSPYKLYKPLVGDSITVTAFDSAGNTRVETISWPGYVSTKWFEIILVLIGLASIVWFIKKKIK